MSMTLEQIVQETRQWPQDQMAELVDRLTQELHISPKVGAAWRKEIRRRVAEIESGRVKGIPGESVSERVRRIVRTDTNVRCYDLTAGGKLSASAQ
jgi:putative addiction module component (TIGR02574 family)